ncbi:S41 family peptidase [Geobacillus sp. FSL W8-1251]|uniref:S41 family peptidase n=1 Tax=Geobacillus sp. FSL W8-1251 TaxID=2954650 RepID=UPI0030F6FD09
MKVIQRWTAALLLLAASFSVWSPPAEAATAPASTKVLEEVRKIVRQYYVEPVSDQVLKASTPQDIVKQLDPYSAYMTKEEYEEFLKWIDMESVGIGVMIEEDENGVHIMSVLDNGPAARAGLQPGDVIQAVDGQPVTNETMEKVLSLIAGEEGTTVAVTVWRPSTEETVSVTIKQEKIDWPNVEFKRLAGNIGYIQLYSFDETAPAEIERAIRSLSGVKGWIFDLRDNPGGYVETAQQIAGFFPNVKQAFQLRDRSNHPEVYAAVKQPVQMAGPIRLLVNASSASASEMLAAAVKEQKAAVLYGQRTFGKGSMQEMFELSDGSMLKLTVAHFFSPKGTPIHHVGVKPDVPTVVGKELYAAHRDLLIGQLKGYQSLGKLRNAPVDKTFVVRFSRPLANTAVSGVKLYQLGGREAAVTAQIRRGTELLIKPAAKLAKGQSYLLVIPPVLKSKDGVAMKKGAYMEIQTAASTK